MAKPERGPARQLIGLPFTRERVPLGKLSVHPKVQRSFKPKWAAELAKSFDESAIDELWVVRVGKWLYVFDGQHRMAAIKLYIGDGWEFVDVPCRIYDGLETATLAKLTGNKNNALAWTAIAEFRREVLANDATAVAIDKMVKSLGLVVREDTTPNTVRAVKALRQVYGWPPNGPEVLAWTISILHEAWPEDASGLHQSLIKGAAFVFQKHGAVLDRAGLLHRMRAHLTPDGVLGQARAYARATGISVPQAVYSVLLRSYNTGRRRGRIDEE